VRNKVRFKLTGLVVLAVISAVPATGAVLYNNLTPNNLMAIASRPGTATFEIEAADDFVLTSPSSITSASFTGVITGASGVPSIVDIVVEIYRVFPADSNTARTPNVPTRANSPSDVAFDSRDSAAGELSFATSVLSTTFVALNSIQPGGIHPSPAQTTGGNGPLIGQEIQFNVSFTTPFTLPADHYFFVPQVEITSGGQFYWLSASRPITGTGTTPFTTDLQAWTRDQALDPDWLRVGMDIVGGTTPPTFNTAFSLEGNAVPEPDTILLIAAGLALVGIGKRKGISLGR
jgi:hypothetical protein